MEFSSQASPAEAKDIKTESMCVSRDPSSHNGAQGKKNKCCTTKATWAVNKVNKKHAWYQ